MATIERFVGKYRFLSNFYHSPFEENGIVFKTVEHYYQAHKAHNPEDFIAIVAAHSPSKAKEMGGGIGLRMDWEEIKDNIMLKALRLKFSPTSELAGKLMETGPARLVEGNTWGDKYWGVCQGKGKNRLGCLLMRVRKELFSNPRARKKTMTGMGKFLGTNTRPKQDRLAGAIQGKSKEEVRRAEMTLLVPEHLPKHVGDKPTARGVVDRCVKIYFPDKESWDLFNKYFKVSGMVENSVRNINLLLALLQGLDAGSIAFNESEMGLQAVQGGGLGVGPAQAKVETPPSRKRRRSKDGWFWHPESDCVYIQEDYRNVSGDGLEIFLGPAVTKNREEIHDILIEEARTGNVNFTEDYIDMIMETIVFPDEEKPVRRRRRRR